MSSIEGEKSNIKLEEIALIVPTRDEEAIVKNNLNLMYSYLLENFKHFEIIVCDYSIDKTPIIVRELSNVLPGIVYIEICIKGIGANLKAGMIAAKFDTIMVYPIDMSWNIECIRDSILALSADNVVLGSRGHYNSIVKRSMKRKIFSKLYITLVNLFFRLNATDTQCTIAIKKEQLRSFLDRLDSEGSFFTTELLIYAKKKNLKIIEIPVVVNDTRKDSKINPIRDGFSMFNEIVTEYKEINK